MPKVDNRKELDKKLSSIAKILAHKILEAVLESLPVDKEKSPDTLAIAIVDKWIVHLKDHAKPAAIKSNRLMNLMDGLAHEIAIKIRGHHDPRELSYQEHPEFKNRNIQGWTKGQKVEVKVFRDPEYLTTFYLTRSFDSPNGMGKIHLLEFILTSAQLHTVFTRYCANQHTKNRYKNSTSLGSCLANYRKVMEKGGWEYVRGRNLNKLTYKRKGGYDYWRFSKVINAIES